MRMEKTKEERISTEKRRLRVHYKSLPKNKLALVGGLIDNAAFMRVTLEDLQRMITENGIVDEYQNGANQKGVKQTAEVQAYNAMIKNYNATIERLEKLMPVEQAKKSKLMELADE